jgi:hypothetical protein
MTSGDPTCAAARAIAAAVRAVPGVLELTAGPGGAAATHGRGVRVRGIVLAANGDGWRGAARLIVAAYCIRETAALAQAAAVEAAATAGLSLRQFDVFIDDVLADPGQP